MSQSRELFRVTGVEETCRALDKLERLIRVGAMVRALNAAGQVLMDAIQADTPVQMVGPGEGTVAEGEHLATSLVMELVVDRNGKAGYVLVGFGKLGYRAYWIEYGHRMIGHEPDKKELKGPKTPDAFVEPHPFIRRAFEAAAPHAIEAFIQSVTESLESAELAA